MPNTALSVISRAGRLAADLLYPRACVLCRRSGSFLCEACYGTLPAATPARCHGCWRPVLMGVPCYRCDERPLALEAVRAAFEYDSRVRAVVHQFKFKNFSALAPDLARSMAVLAAGDRELRSDVIVPVPLSGAHMRERGYNQAALLAREIGGIVGLPVVDALRRTRQGGLPQSRTTGAGDRWQNVAGAFELARNEAARAIAGRSVLLIDDVVTTGATLDACAQVLQDAGAARINALTFARQD